MSFFEQLGQITVLWPRMLWLLAPLPILVAMYVAFSARRRNVHARLARLSTLAASADLGVSLRKTLPPVLFFVGIAALIASVSRPQAVVMYLGGPLGGELMKASWALGASPMFYGMSIVPGELTAKVAGERARGLAISQVVPYPWGEADPVVRGYRRLAEAAKVPVGYYTWEGYLNGLVLLEGLRRVGRDLTRARLHAAMRTFRLRLAGMEVDFTGGGPTGSRFVELVQVAEGGRFVR